MRFRSKPREIEATQYLADGPLPPGVKINTNGSRSVTTMQGEEVIVHPGEWIVLEPIQPPVGIRAYPIAQDIFGKFYETIR